MNHWTERLKMWMDRAGLNVPDLSRLSGVSEANLYKYLRRRTDAPRGDVLSKLARAFGKSDAELRYGISPDQGASVRQIPLLDANKLGTIETIREAISDWRGPTVLVPAFDASETFFCIEVRDHACIPKMEVGDTIMVDIQAVPEPGDFVVAYIAALDRNVTRRFRPLEAMSVGHFQLIATNPDFPPITVKSESDGHIIGKVRKIVKDA